MEEEKKENIISGDDVNPQEARAEKQEVTQEAEVTSLTPEIKIETQPEATKEEIVEEEDDELTGIEEATEQEIIEKVTKKEIRKPKRKRSDRQAQDKNKQDGHEWIEKVVQIRRVTKVVKGGKKLSFRAVVIVGNAKGQVGVGVGKAAEVISAIQKGVVDAKKSLVTVPLIRSTIPHMVLGRSGAAKVLLRPAKEGAGIIAGGAARTVLELGGVGDVLSKSLGARSPLNVARATLNGIQQLRKFGDVARSRGMTVKEMLGVS